MRITTHVDGVEHEVELGQVAEAATLGDVVEAATGLIVDPAEALWVDDRRHRADDRVHGLSLLEGSRIARSPTNRPQPIQGWAAAVSGGLDSGPTAPVPPTGRLDIGRAPNADLTVSSPSVSWNHATVEREGDGLRIRDAGSTNGSRIDGKPIPDGGVFVDKEAVVTAGGAVITLRPDNGERLAPAPGSLHNLTASSTAPFNRPPRPGRLAPAEAVQPPLRREPPTATPFSVATVVGPLVLACVMAIWVDPRYAALAALSPILGVGTWFEQRRRRRIAITREEERFRGALETFREELEAAAEVERTRRREEVPDPAIVLRRASLPTTRLWQRRPGAGDFLSLYAGVADVPWNPPIESSVGRLDETVKEIVSNARITAGPVKVDLNDAGVVGVVGEREAALALVRSLVCQAAVHCGPADLTVAVVCDQGREDDWSWTTWLPHTRRVGDGTGGRWVSAQRARSESMLRAMRDGMENHPTPAVLLVVDSDVLTEGRDAPARTLLGRGRRLDRSSHDRYEVQVCGIVIAATEEQLPASCTTIVRVGDDAEATVSRPNERLDVDDVLMAGINTGTARQCAIDLARFDDPEIVVPGAALPSMVRLPPLLGIQQLTADAIRASWASATGFSTPIGVGESGSFVVDLVRDGPHGLVGGTTGSGKSEFLRSLVAGLAARNDPTRLTFILIDFKGGAAFASMEQLPHTIGTVSNLDEQLADRALRALEAELRYRQRLFAEAGEGIDNLDAYLATHPAQPLPRLVLVVDEFAMLAKEYPDVLSSLVSVAAVGRTLGVHMILATQRPAGVVNEDILANTNLRVALRVQSRDDSVNVVGVPNAASIARTQMGRAFVKLGQDDITPVQTALVTGRSEAQSSVLVDAHPVTFGGESAARTAEPVADDVPSDLDLLIDAIVEANAQAGFDAPRPVWPEALGQRVALAATDLDGPQGSDVPVVGGMDELVVQFALSDDPDRQRQIPAGWDLDRGNLLLLGIPGSGTSTALVSLALTLAAQCPPDELDLLVLDMGSRDLAPLEDLPHTTAYVGSGSGAREQQVRLLKYLRAELDRRRAEPGPHRRLVVLVDGLGALKDEYDDFEGLKLLEGLYRAYSDGPDVRMWVAATTARSKAVPPAIDEVTTQKWLFRLADAYDYSAAGISPRNAPAAVAGRCVIAETGLHTHVATPSVTRPEAVAHVASGWAGVAAKQTVVRQLPERVTMAELGVTASVRGEPWRLPVGIREFDLMPAVLEAYEGEHILVAGAARSGKSTLLLAMAEGIRAGAHADAVEVTIWGLCGRRSPLTGAGLNRTGVGKDDHAALLASARVHRGKLVLLVDDAEQFDDSDQAIAGLLASRTSDLLVIAAGRADDLRSLYSHWTKTVRKSRCGVLLQPNVDYDGELLGVSLPRRAPVAVTTGRGYVAMGGAESFVQCASPSLSKF